MKQTYCFFLLFLIANSSLAQKAKRCNTYDCAIKAAEAQLKTKNIDYQTALNHLDDAEDFAGNEASKKQAIRALRKSVFVAIENEKKKAIKATKEAKRQETIASEAANIAQAAKERAQAVLDKIYFFDDKFGLAYDKSANDGSGGYGFIDKNLNIKIDYKYIDALPFDNRGFAKVKLVDEYFLIDTLGNEYKLATEINQLDSTITALDLSNKNVDTIPKVITQNAQLKIILLNSNKINILPNDFAALKSLTSLDLSDNQLNELSHNFGALENLTSLNLSKNQLKELPHNFVTLKSITSLDLSDNQLNELPHNFGALKNLISLYLSFNQLKELPINFGELKNLTSLNLSNNQLKELPINFGELKNLASFYLSFNHLNELPTNFGELKKLTLLDLSKNKLKELPTNFGELKNLTSLGLFGNQLTALPTNFGELRNLIELNLPSTLGLREVNNVKKAIPNSQIKYQNGKTLFKYIETENELLVLEKKIALKKLEEELKTKKLDLKQKLAIYQKIIALNNEILQLDSTFSKKDIAQYYNSYAWHQLLNVDFKGTEESLISGIRYDKTNKFFYSNIAPSLLFQGKYQKANAEYQKWKDEQFDKNRKYKDIFLIDFKTFEKENIIPPQHKAEVERIKKMLQE